MKVAVVGSGVSGLAATWLLNEHSDHEVHLFEADDRPGGHANTVHYVPPADGKGQKAGVDVDTGFIVFNPDTYPNFIAFLKRYPHIKIDKTEMTFSVSRDRGFFEWAGNNPLTLFTQPTRLLDPTMWRLIYDILRFNACARRLARGPPSMFEDDYSIGEYLDSEGYSSSFRNNYLIPMTAAIWSTPADRCVTDFPAQTLIRFMSNHHLLQVTGRPSWLTLWGGSKTYVDTIIQSLPVKQLHLSTPVTSVSSASSLGGKDQPRIELTTASGETHHFDHVILATHTDTSLAVLEKGVSGVTELERDVLTSVGWNRNEVVLHCDTKLMPVSRMAWSCWNYLSTSRTNVDNGADERGAEDIVSLTYCMNILQHINEKRHGPVLVTLNAPFEPEESMTFGRYKYDHPILDAKATHAQKRLHQIQAKRGISFAGAWTNFGFHEDGFTSGLRAALSVSSPTTSGPSSSSSARDAAATIRPPFEVMDPDREPHLLPALATFFDVFEASGVRALVGAVLGFWLAVVRRVVGLVVDLRHIDVEIRREAEDERRRARIREQEKGK